MRRHYDLPFGAELFPDLLRFRLWRREQTPCLRWARGAGPEWDPDEPWPGGWFRCRPDGTWEMARSCRSSSTLQTRMSQCLGIPRGDG
jgi:hypothetical protein